MEAPCKPLKMTPKPYFDPYAQNIRAEPPKLFMPHLNPYTKTVNIMLASDLREYSSPFQGAS